MHTATIIPLKEKEIHIPSGNLSLEGRLYQQSTDYGLIVTHPHPLYGGDMHNRVVDIVQQVFAQKNFTTLRFNFRGTGQSQGRYDNGHGEQEDVLAAVGLLEQIGVGTIVLAGYSFGAWINALASDRLPDRMQLVMISPPVAFIDFEDVQTMANLALIITGSRDEIAPPAQVKKLASNWNPKARLEIIHGADHFYSMMYKRLEEILGGFAAGFIG